MGRQANFLASKDQLQEGTHHAVAGPLQATPWLAGLASPFRGAIDELQPTAGGFRLARDRGPAQTPVVGDAVPTTSPQTGVPGIGG